MNRLHRENQNSVASGCNSESVHRAIGKTENATVCGQVRLRTGYTLLEVVLALALSVLLIGGISMAINYHLITLRDQQEEIERSQVARQSLFLVTKDIRAAIQYKPVESSALTDLIDSISGGADLEALAEGAGIGEEMIDDAGLIPADETDAAPSDYAATRPALIGTSTQLQLDVSRLPRKDQYNIVNFSDGTQSDIPSDVKTITYFVRTEENAEETSSSNSVDINESMGLIRRSLDRAVTRYSEDYGAQVNLADYEEVLAEEITQIEFRYWDKENESWETEWDSEEMMGLPSAIEISIALGTRSNEDDDAIDDRKIYRSVVYLPLAEIIPPELETPDEEEMTTSSASGDSGSSGSGSEESGAGGTDR